MISHIVRALVAAGATPEIILAAVEAAEAEQITSNELARARPRLRHELRTGGRSESCWERLRTAVFERDGYRCVYCGQDDADEGLHVDHVHPVSRGGLATPANLVTACPQCNTSKGAKTLEEWLRT